MKMSTFDCILNMIKNKGDLVITDNSVTSLPDNLHVGGKLIILSEGLKELPKGLVVDKDVDISYLNIATIPPDITVKGTLTINNKVTSGNIPPIHVGSLKVFNACVVDIPYGFEADKDIIFVKEDKSEKAKVSILGNIKVGGDVSFNGIDFVDMFGSVSAKGSIIITDASIVNIYSSTRVGCNLSLENVRNTNIGHNLAVEGNAVFLNANPHEFDTKNVQGRTIIKYTGKMTYKLAKEIMEKNEGNLIVPPGIDSLPNGLVIPNSLYLMESKLIKELPSDIVIGKSLFGQKSALESLPENLTIPGSLVLYESALKQLPNELKVGEDIDVSKTAIKEIPAGIRVGKSLLAKETDIIFVPSLNIPGSLDISKSAVKQISPELTVGDSLYALEINLERVFPPLQIPGDLYLRGASLPFGLAEGLSVHSLDLKYAKVDFLPYVINIAGSLDAAGSTLSYLPNGFTVPCNLDIRNTEIATIPENIFVGKSLDISGLKITEIPPMMIGEDLIARSLKLDKQVPPLVIKGNVDFSYSAFNKGISGEFFVGENLCLHGTVISEFPNGITVVGAIVDSLDDRSEPVHGEEI